MSAKMVVKETPTKSLTAAAAAAAVIWSKDLIQQPSIRSFVNNVLFSLKKTI